MDRRQKKSREAIFSAFTSLLSKKSYHKITVGEIIELADVGRATFYAHFETKDYLLKALCEELFGHITSTAMGLPDGHFHCSRANSADSVFLHLLRHLQENDLNILGLLSSENNEIFLKYFKNNLKHLIVTQYAEKGKFQDSNLPEEYLINHIASTFVETADWWISRGRKESPEQINEYFLMATEPIMK